MCCTQRVAAQCAAVEGGRANGTPQASFAHAVEPAVVHSDIPRHGPTPCPPKVQQRSPQVVLLVFTVCQDGQHCTYSPHRRCSERFDLLKHVVEDHADDQVCEQHWQTSSAPANADQKMAHPGGSGARRFERDFDTASVRESASMQVVSVRVRVCVSVCVCVRVRRWACEGSGFRV